MSFFSGWFGGGGAAAPAAAPTATAPPAPTATTAPPSKHCLRRIRNDLRALERDAGGMLFACVADDADFTAVDAMIVGLEGTPYAGGFFHFKVRFPPAYPCDCPKVELATTGRGTVGFNPNLYANGKSLMHDRPYVNEPGREAAAACAPYNEVSAVRDAPLLAPRNVDASSAEYRAMPAPMRRFCADEFLRRFDDILALVDAAVERGEDGRPHRDPTNRSSASGAANYGELRRELVALRAATEARVAREDRDDDDDAAPPAADAAADTNA
ncbi:hypothetical protein JL722_1755 [Aureococcus anophagefferens]|nr:hypothetical protein JL722_1755 [Aureococcus anophagefferens]